VLPTSLAITVLTALLTLGAVALFAWAWWRGCFRDFEGQARVIFEPRDWRLERPWESPAERLAREAAYGPAQDPAPGEWGGAA
jgi:hypothetical protein